MSGLSMLQISRDGRGTTYNHYLQYMFICCAFWLQLTCSLNSHVYFIGILNFLIYMKLILVLILINNQYNNDYLISTNNKISLCSPFWFNSWTASWSPGLVSQGSLRRNRTLATLQYLTDATGKTEVRTADVPHFLNSWTIETEKKTCFWSIIHEDRGKA